MDLINQAILFATNEHKSQKRKYSNLPYILHPMEVATIIATMTTDPEVIVAGLLHDTIEDCETDPNTIQEMFGDRVLFLVKSETEEKMREQSPEDTWVVRKTKSLQELHQSKDIGVKILWLADKLSNTRSFCREMKKENAKVWDKLHQKDSNKQEWYYRQIAKELEELSETDAYQEYIYRINILFGEKK